MQVDRDRLAEQFSMLDDDALMRRYRSGDLTPLAGELAAAELAARGIDATPAIGDVPFAGQVDGLRGGLLPEPPEPRGDIVCLTRLRGLMDAQILCARLRAEGIAAFAGDSELIRANGFLNQALGGIRIMVCEADLARAGDVMAALKRGDFALGEDDAVEDDPGD